MTYSMTAFARKDVRADWGNASWEIRSVNQRYLETYLRLPESFRGLDPVLRDKLRARLNRGKVEVQLRFEAAAADANTLAFNASLAEMLMARAGELAAKVPGAQVNVVDVLRWPGVMNAPEADLDAISEDLLKAFDDTLQDFIDARAREGANLKELIEARLAGVLEEVAKVRTRMPEVLAWQRERMQNRFEEAKVELDPARLEQEMVMLASRVDVAEELDRLESHVKETRAALKKGGAIGRRLDFMMQEFNREANTLGSKSINADITASSVELKVLIEQMREQIQNIE
ncbi:YicC family protein [Gallaecimonas kandeliae]|uniref:YicC/YloC family endoribonuclease n=1 Tax=Gallaecimonas kandeliae TaxID=3029055 RepID=UPI00264A4AFD|nr:YicC/YloC family endoribonuclease [Gallaecimonas kandeliae]WKE65795.1 YicC family protein [Gallaecimonas kandeliae]